ncbi:uncharacterized protein [Ptychodera flava]|uniref:uncharacterized protein n=1 Tax=Ptychodera flava TaxID=63121 RepID=UPI00396A67FE
MVSLFLRVLASHCFLLTLIFSSVVGATSSAPSVEVKSENNNDTALVKCLVDRPEPAERLWYEDGEILPIILETSNKSSHLIVTYTLAILFKEVLGLRDVEISHLPGPMDINSIMQRMSGCHHAKPWQCTDNNVAKVPETMITLEAWVDIDQKDTADDWMNTGLISDAGQLGTAGRYGWYEPNFVVDYLWEEFERVGDHWRILTQPSANQLFWIEADILDELTLREGSENERYCEDVDCTDGVYRPISCPRNESRCAVLLAEYPDMNKDILIGQIESLELNVTIAWIGPKLESYVQNCHDRHQPVLFLNWVSNGIISTGNYSRITFPNCIGTTEGRDCDFKLNVLEKYTWHRVEWGLPNAYSTLKDMEFSQNAMDEILRNQYVNKLTEQEAACQWVQENQEVWIEWIPGVVVNQTIIIGGMFSNTGSVWPEPGIEPAAWMAIEAINADPDVLTIYNLDMTSYDTQCSDHQAMLAYLQYLTDLESVKIGIIGPACSNEAETIAGMSKYFRNIMISYSSEAPQLSNRDKYPYFYRTYPPASDHADCYVLLFEYFDWTQCATLTEDGNDFIQTLNVLHETFATNNINVISSRKFPAYQHSLDMSLYISEIKDKKAHIVIGNFYEYAARAVLCEAYHQKATAHDGYQWFVPSWFSPNWWDTDYFNSAAHSPRESVPCTTAEMAVAIQGLMTFSTTNLQDENKEVIGGVTRREFYDKYHEIVESQGIPPSSYAPYAYDAVWVMAVALDRLLEYDVFALSTITSNETVQTYMDFIDDTDFKGLTGDVYFDGADRIFPIDILQTFPNVSINIGLYIPGRENESNTFTVFDNKIIWVTGYPPTDGKYDYIPCVFGEPLRQALNTECSTIVIIVNILIFGTVFLIIFVSCVIFKKKYDRKVKATDERMRELGLMLNEGFLSMDDWEMPRENIVLNRKLGEGAFGTVYGGEAMIEGQWLAVAVKTLKVGSSIEDKLDFLSEAEVMKQLDHVNIVSLLGICTRGEPAYTVMEYMLHGDLKTFLLSRRQFVSQPDKKGAEEISEEKLTEMAFDVAAGLDYLSKKNFVHRDLACRNCLVHASLVVKIGDFGMTRSLYDSDYYRYGKKGMLPVRWMAPESLLDGLFTMKSDIWSLGVVFYEIVTFGSFPYQGLSNTQVLEALKNKETLKLSDECSPELKELFKWCWSIDPEDRPTALQLMEKLGTQSTLITPCLSAPSSCKEISNSNDPPPPLPPRNNKNKFKIQSPITKRKALSLQRSQSTCTPQLKRKHGEKSQDVKGNFHRSSTLTKKDIDTIIKIQQSKQMTSGCKRKISSSKNQFMEGKQQESGKNQKTGSIKEKRHSKCAVEDSAVKNQTNGLIIGKSDNSDHTDVQIIINSVDNDDGIGNDSIASDDMSMNSGSDSRHQSTSSQDSLLPRHKSNKLKKVPVNRSAINFEHFPAKPSLSLTEVMSTIV